MGGMCVFQFIGINIILVGVDAVSGVGILGRHGMVPVNFTIYRMLHNTHCDILNGAMFSVTLDIKGGQARPAYAIITNHPYHYDLEGPHA